jgi:uncharacterized protein with beta-barrel porin domain
MRAINKFYLKPITAVCVGLLASSVNAQVTQTLVGDYIKIGTSSYGTIGSGGNTSPGILYDNTGTGTFNTSYDYLTPGTPFEGFTVQGAWASGNFSAVNNNTGTANNVGTLADNSSTGYVGVTWTGSYSSGATKLYDIVNSVGFNTNAKQVSVTTTITAAQNLTGVKFARYTDPDARAAAGDSSSTRNIRGTSSVSANNVVYAEALASLYVIGLYSSASSGVNTGVSSGWSTNATTYINGQADGDGDYTIGIGFDVGDMTSGQSVILRYNYIFGADISTAIALAVSSGGNSATFISSARSRGFNKLADYFESNSSAFTTLVNALNALDGTSLDIALRKLNPSTQTAAMTSVTSASNVASSIMFEKAGTFIGDFTSNRSLTAKYSGKSYVGDYLPSSNMSLQQLAENLSINPIDFRQKSQLGQLGFYKVASTQNYKKFSAGQFGGWLQGFYDVGFGDTVGGSTGFINRTHGIVGAIEYGVDENHLLGLMISPSKSKSDMRESAGNIDSTSTQYAIYGQKIIDTIKLTSSLGYGHSKYSGNRNIQVDSINEVARSNYAGDLYSVNFAASQLHGFELFDIEPFVQVAYSINKTGSYTETGAGVYNLSVQEAKSEVGSLTLGATVSFDYKLSNLPSTLKIKPAIKTQKQFVTPESSVSFSGGVGSTVYDSRRIEPFNLSLGVENALNIDNLSRLRVGLSHQNGKDYRSYQGFVQYEKLF